MQLDLDLPGADVVLDDLRERLQLNTVAEFTSACAALGGTYAAAAAKADAANARATAAEAGRGIAAAEAARLQLFANPLRLTLTAPPKLGTLGTTGVKTAITAGPLKPVTVRLLTTAAKAKALKLKSRVLGAATATTTAAGTAAITVKTTAAATRAIKASKTTKSLALTVETVSQRSASLKSTVKG